MRDARWSPADRGVAVVLLTSLAILPVEAADLKSRTLAAYEQYIDSATTRFLHQIDGETFLGIDRAALSTIRNSSTVLLEPGSDDGILDVDDGLIHHWRGAAFLPGATLDQVLAAVRNFRALPDVYPAIVGTRVFDHSQDAQGDRYRVLMRMTRRAGGVTSVLDLWTVVSYRYPRTDRAAAISDAECIRQVKNAGEPDEHLLPSDTGSGFLWRANTFAKYLERDGGVYVELDNIGLSRDFPPLLGWLIAPIARDLGRSSVEQKLTLLRDALQRRNAQHVADATTTPRLPAFWCAP